MLTQACAGMASPNPNNPYTISDGVWAFNALLSTWQSDLLLCGDRHRLPTSLVFLCWFCHFCFLIIVPLLSDRCSDQPVRSVPRERAAEAEEWARRLSDQPDRVWPVVPGVVTAVAAVHLPGQPQCRLSSAQSSSFWVTLVQHPSRTQLEPYERRLRVSLLLFCCFQGDDWRHREWLCQLCGFLLYENIYISIGFLCCISLDRYLAVVHPLK